MRILLLFIMLLIGTLAKAQDLFYVVFINHPGDITYSSSGKIVSVKDAIKSKTKLRFRPDAKMTCISIEKGSFYYDGAGIPNNNMEGIIGSLSALLKPSPKLGSFKTRGANFKGYDLKTYFHSELTDNRILLINHEALPIDAQNKNNAEDIFFIQFDDRGKTVTRKIPETKEGLIFDEMLFRDKEGMITDQPYLLCVRRKEGDRKISEKIAAFYPKFAERVDISSQVETIKRYAKVKSNDELSQLILNHLYQNYGKIGIEIFDKRE